MSSHVNVALETVGSLHAVAHCTSSLSLSLHSEPVTSTTVKSLVPLESSLSLQLLWSEAVSSPSKLCSINPPTNTSYLTPSLQQTAASIEIQTRKQRWRNKQSIGIWVWCHTPFQSYIAPLRDDSDNIRFLFHFTVRGTHKTVCEIRDCKKKTRNSREEKKMKK